MQNKISVLGAGLAGCEATWQLAKNGIHVDLYEMKPQKYTPAQSYAGFAELVCSNSLKAARLDSAAGLLKEEMRMLGSLCMESAATCSVPAGGALAVDREKFSDYITEKIRSNSNITVVEGEVKAIPDGIVVIATGPLTSDDLAIKITELVDEKGLSFFDAAAPIIDAQSIDMSIAFSASRYDEEQVGDYINCPMNKEEYEHFHAELIAAQTAPLKEIDRQDFKVYEGCMPIEVLAKRGHDAIRFGPLKPVGLTDPRTGHRPWACVQLRKENTAATMYNIVGFQTNLKWGEQKRVFSLIPGLGNAEFYRYGVMHRNTFLNSPKLLDRHFRLRKNENIFFAGQITGVEGYMESAASGVYVGYNIARMLAGKALLDLPQDTMLGSLSLYISDPNNANNFQPMGANMGVMPPLEEHIRNKKLRYAAVAERAVNSLKAEIERNEEL